MELYIYTTSIDNVDRQLVSALKSDFVFKNGLNGKSIIGHLKDTSKQQLTSDNIVYNTDFVDLFQKVIRQTSLQSIDLINAAKEQVNGFIYLIDQRTNDKINTKPRDIVCAFEVKDGDIIPESFQANKNYEIISKEGTFKLPKVYEQNLLTAMTE